MITDECWEIGIESFPSMKMRTQLEQQPEQMHTPQKKIGQKTQWYMFIDVLTTSYLYFEHTPLLLRILLFSTALCNCKLPSFHVIIFRFSRLIDPECCHNLQGGRRLFEQFDTQPYQINDFQLIT